MNQLVRDTWASVDVIAMLVDAEGGIGGGDEYLVRELSDAAHACGHRPQQESTRSTTTDLLPGAGADRTHDGRGTVRRRRAPSPRSPAATSIGSSTCSSGICPRAHGCFAAGRVSDQPEGAARVRDRAREDHRRPRAGAPALGRRHRRRHRARPGPRRPRPHRRGHPRRARVAEGHHHREGAAGG